jgi:hypothetical protein
MAVKTGSAFEAPGLRPARACVARPCDGRVRVVVETTRQEKKGKKLKMKRVLILSVVLLIVGSSAFAGLVNGDFSAGEAGWTRWAAPWSVGINWAITGIGPTPPEARASMNPGGQGSFGWYQVYECPAGWVSTVNGMWSGDIGGAGWAEIMLFSVAPGTPDPVIVNKIDTGAAADIAFKKDSWGMNPPVQWGWQPVGLSPHPNGNGGIVTSQGWVVVAIKLGSVTGQPVQLAVDNLTSWCVPEPASILALSMGLGALLIRRRK